MKGKTLLLWGLEMLYDWVVRGDEYLDDRTERQQTKLDSLPNIDEVLDEDFEDERSEVLNERESAIYELAFTRGRSIERSSVMTKLDIGIKGLKEVEES